MKEDRSAGVRPYRSKGTAGRNGAINSADGAAMTGSSASDATAATGRRTTGNIWCVDVIRSSRDGDQARRTAVRERLAPDPAYATRLAARSTDTDALPDRRTELLCACADPAIDPAMHTPLMMQAVLGLDAEVVDAANRRCGWVSDGGRAGQMSPIAHSTYTTPIATTPFTNVTPPSDTSAERNDMRESVMQTQK